MSIVNLAVAVHTYDRADIARTEAGQLIIAGFKGLDYLAFGAQQVSIIAQLVSAKLSDNPDSAKRMVQRTLENLGIERPKSESKVSVDKQEKRETAKLESAKLVADSGITADSTAEEILAKAGKVTGAQQRALTDAAIVKNKETEKAKSVAFTALKAETIKALKLADATTIGKVRKLLGLK